MEKKETIPGNEATVWPRLGICAAHQIITLDGEPIDNSLEMVPVEVRRMHTEQWLLGLMYIPTVKKHTILGISLDRNSEWSTYWTVKCIDQLCMYRVILLQEDSFGPFGVVVKPVLGFCSARPYNRVVPKTVKILFDFYAADPW